MNNHSDNNDGVNIPLDNPEEEKEEEQEQEQETSSKVSEYFEAFFRSFVRIDPKTKKKTLYYQDLVSQIITTDDWIIPVHDLDLPPDLHDRIFRSPNVEENLDAMNEALISLFKEMHPARDSNDANRIQSRIVIDDEERVLPMRMVDIDLRNTLIMFDSTIVATSEIKSAIKKRRYICTGCPLIYDKPTKECAACKSKKIKFSLNHSTFTRFQTIELQERQDDKHISSAVPVKLEAKVYGDLVNKYRAGDNVRVTGFAKLHKSVSDKQLQAEIDEEFSTDIIFDLVVEVHNLQLLSTSYDMIVNDPSKILTQEDIKNIKEQRERWNDEQLTDIFINSFADHILGWDREKESILYQLVGSIIIQINKNTMKRPDINILFIGDPGTTKTSLLEEAAKLSIHGIYTSGKGSSGVGLTASVGKDGKGVNRLTVGAAVLADKGLCAVDEYLTISDEDREYLLQCMESGAFSINKGGINAKLNTRCAFLMATNSINGKYNPYTTLKTNVPLSDQEYSRFGFVSVMRDIVKRETDEAIADHMLKLYFPQYKPKIKQDKLVAEIKKVKFERDFLFKWIVFAKTNNLEGIKFTDEAIKLIKSFYNEIRSPVKETDVTATPRQLEDIIRFCIARARFMLRNIVTEDDVLQIIRLMTYGYQSCGFMLKGAESAGLNMTAEYSKPLNKLAKPLAFIEVVLKLTKGNKEPVSREAIEVELIHKAAWERSEAADFFYKMYEVKGELMQPVPGKYVLTKDYGSSFTVSSSGGNSYRAEIGDGPGKIKEEEIN